MYRLFFAISVLSILACSDPDSIAVPDTAPATLRLANGSYDLVIREVLRSNCGDVGFDVVPAELSGRSPVELSLPGWELSGNYRSGLLSLSGHPSLHGGDDPVPVEDGTVTVDEDGEIVDSGAPADPAEDRPDDRPDRPDRPVDDCGDEEPNAGASSGSSGGGATSPGDEGDRDPCGSPSERAEASLTLRLASAHAAEGLLEVRASGCSLSARVSLLPAREDGPVVVVVEEEEPVEESDTGAPPPR